MYPQNIAQQGYNQHQHVPLQDADLSNAVLNELKRVAREYATACLEASNTDIRHLFEQLLHQTLRDQEHLYQTINQLNLYGQPGSAAQNELHKEAQNHQQQLGGLQSFMQQWHGANRGRQAGFRQNENNQQQQQFQQNQQNQQNQQQLQNQQYQRNQQQLENQQFQRNQQNPSRSMLQQRDVQEQQAQLEQSRYENHNGHGHYGLQQQGQSITNTQPVTQQHHSSAVMDAIHETGSEPASNHTTGTTGAPLLQ